MKKKLFLFAVSILLLSGCQTIASVKDKKGGATELSTKVIEKSRPTPPEWIEDPSKSAGPAALRNAAYFVGVSSAGLPTPYSAHQDAYADAIGQIYKKAGINADVRKMQIKKITPKSYRIIFSEGSGPPGEKPIAEFLEANSLPLGDYWEKFGTYRNGKLQKTYYRHWIRVGIPKKTLKTARAKVIKNIQAEKKKSLSLNSSELADQLIANIAPDAIRKMPINLVYGNFKTTRASCVGVFIRDFGTLLKKQISGYKGFIVKGELKIGTVPVKDEINLKMESHLSKLSGNYILHGDYENMGHWIRVRGFIAGPEGLVSSGTSYVARDKITDPLIEKGCVEADYFAKSIPSLKKKNDFQLLLWTEKGDGALYKKGEKIAIQYSVPNRAYLKIFSIAPNGKVIVLSDSKKRKIEKNEPLAIRLIAQARGTETIVAIASDKKFKKNFKVGQTFSAEDFPSIYTTLREGKGKIGEEGIAYTVLD